MKQFLQRLFLMLFVVAPLALAAQNEAPTTEASEEETSDEESMEDFSEPEDTTLRATFGVFGNVHAGMTYGTFGDLATELGTEDVFDNEEYNVRGLGTNIGGQLHLLLFKRVMISGGGNYYEYSSSLSQQPSADDSVSFNQERDDYNRGEAKVSGYTVGGNIGFAVLNKKQYLLWPYVGYTFGESELEVKNYSTDIMRIGDVELDRAETQTYTSSLGMIEGGVGFRYMMDPKGGLMFGAELGGYYNIAGNNYETEDGVELTDFTESSLAGGYLRFTFGGGIFGNTQSGGEEDAEFGEDAYDENADEGMAPEGAEGEMGEDEMGEDEMSDKEKRKAEKKRAKAEKKRKKAEEKARKKAEKEAAKKAKEEEQADEEVEEAEEGGLE
ncbi:MAG: hypothetical protein ACOCZ8_03805 [Bacteroidota bacterium]